MSGLLLLLKQTGALLRMLSCPLVSLPHLSLRVTIFPLISRPRLLLALRLLRLLNSPPKKLLLLLLGPSPLLALLPDPTLCSS